LVVNPAATTAAAANASATFSAAVQTVALSATVTSPAGTVSEGGVTFTVLNGSPQVGSPVTTQVANRPANPSYTLPGGPPVGTYNIRVAYNGTASFLPSSDAGHLLTVSTSSQLQFAAPFFSALENAGTVTLTVTRTGPTGMVTVNFFTSFRT